MRGGGESLLVSSSAFISTGFSARKRVDRKLVSDCRCFIDVCLGRLPPQSTSFTFSRGFALTFKTPAVQAVRVKQTPNSVLPCRRFV